MRSPYPNPVWIYLAPLWPLVAMGLILLAVWSAAPGGS